MTRIIGSPSLYIQGKEELKNLGKYTMTLGSRVFVLVDKNIQHIVMPNLVDGMSCVAYTIAEFCGECCLDEIHCMCQKLQANGSDVVVGIGGGKVQDVAKAVAYYTKLPVVIVPTTASTDAPCTSIAVLYSSNGVFDKYLYLPSSPNVVLVDSEVIAKAPARLLAAGIGDALSTYFEARACYLSGADNCFKSKVTKTALALAKLCYEILLEDGAQAYKDVSNKQCTQAVENIIEANIYLSGVGFEASGLAGAHAIAYALSNLKETKHLLHGEMVAFGTIAQLMLEKTDVEEIKQVIRLCKKLKLPTTLAELGIEEIHQEEIMNVAKASCRETMKNMPFKVEAEDVYMAIISVDELGRSYGL